MTKHHPPKKPLEVRVKINDQDITCESSDSILKACQKAGVEVPVFCYHDKLKVSGNCRMCLVENSHSQKLVTSCSMTVEDGMQILTDSPLVQDARKGNIEFLLINHPLECPVCDRSGECCLQDMAVKYGSDRGCFKEEKRAVSDHDLGPFIGSHMSRCIHCTRCVRFAEDIAGVPEMGLFHRGEDIQIGTVLHQTLKSELSGNMIDLCPVGALVSKPYAGKARPWELTPIPSVDVTDAIGSNIYIDVKGSEIMRIRPRQNEDINEEWISNKTRFSYDGLKFQRLDTPFIRKDGQLQSASWIDALKTIVKTITSVSPTEIGVIAGNLMDVESLFLMRQLLDSMGIIHRDCFQSGMFLPHHERADYLFNTTIQGIDQSDACLLVGTNPRLDASLVNARLRKRWMGGNFPVGMIGSQVDLTYPYDHLSNTADLLNQLAKGDHFFTKTLKNARNPMLIVGPGAWGSAEAEAIYQTCRFIAQNTGIIRDDWNGFNVLHKAAGFVGGLDVQFRPKENGYYTPDILTAARLGKIKIVYLLGADEISMKDLGKAFVIYQGHHGNAGANRADIILPGASYTEKSGLYVNTEGRVQQALAAVSPPGEAREDWKIIRGLSEVLDHKLSHNTQQDILDSLGQEYEWFKHIGKIIPSPLSMNYKPQTIITGLLRPSVENFYHTDVIGKSSPLFSRV